MVYWENEHRAEEFLLWCGTCYFDFDLHYYYPKFLMKYRIIKLWQKLTRGYTDEEVWDLKTSISDFIIPRLERLQKIRHGYPADLTDEQWQEIISKILRAFYLVKEEYDRGNHMSQEEWLQKDKISEKYKKEGLELFAKYIDNLWD